MWCVWIEYHFPLQMNIVPSALVFSGPRKISTFHLTKPTPHKADDRDLHEAHVSVSWFVYYSLHRKHTAQPWHRKFLMIMGILLTLTDLVPCHGALTQSYWGCILQIANVLFGAMKFGWKDFRGLKPDWLHHVHQQPVCLKDGSKGM